MNRNTRPRNKKPGSKKPAGVRIIGGQWRGRRLPVADVPGLRPTGDRLRETLFNWLQPVISGAHCVDMFAGTGALGLEAASRGAARTVLIERDNHALQALRNACELLKTDNVDLCRGDALAFSGKPPTLAAAPFDVAFIDPPWIAECHAQILRNLVENGWLRDGATVYMEMPKNAEILLSPQLHEINRKIIGEALALLFRYKKNDDL